MELHVLDRRATGVPYGQVAARGHVVGAVENLSPVLSGQAQDLGEGPDDRGGVGAAVGGEGVVGAREKQKSAHGREFQITVGEAQPRLLSGEFGERGQRGIQIVDVHPGEGGEHRCGVSQVVSTFPKYGIDLHTRDAP
ncbi:hypothetical protein ACFYPN_29035 [Streptomyces sp. NPDC005576]|uniref:hypothetical protein n=1 Tax=unclassified Streptomyces TaxID=2593676 RepID=UPI0033E845FC